MQRFSKFVFGPCLSILGVLGVAQACSATRTPAVVACTSDSQCAADGHHKCNQTTNVCEECDGACATVKTDASVTDYGSAADTGVKADTALSSDSSQTDAAMGSDASATE